jgi:hypothetical protein
MHVWTKGCSLGGRTSASGVLKSTEAVFRPFVGLKTQLSLTLDVSLESVDDSVGTTYHEAYVEAFVVDTTWTAPVSVYRRKLPVSGPWNYGCGLWPIGTFCGGRGNWGPTVTRTYTIRSGYTTVPLRGRHFYQIWVYGNSVAEQHVANASTTINVHNIRYASLSW